MPQQHHTPCPGGSTYHPESGGVTIRLQEPSQSEGDGLASANCAEMFSGGDPERVARWSGHPNPV